MSVYRFQSKTFTNTCEKPAPKNGLKHLFVVAGHGEDTDADILTEFEIDAPDLETAMRMLQEAIQRLHEEFHRREMERITREQQEEAQDMRPGLAGMPLDAALRHAIRQPAF